MELRDDWQAFEDRAARVVAISQEDESLADAGKFLQHFGDDGPPFEVVADLQRARTDMLDRATAYLLDPEGVVRQVFPMLLRSRPSWAAILGEIDRLEAEREK